MIAAFMVPRESICKSCEHKIVCAFKIIEERNACITGCSRYEKEHKPTNADRIRSMTDEELDKFLGEVQWDVANYCGGVTQKQEYPIPEQRGAWLDWLREEAKE